MQKWIKTILLLISLLMIDCGKIDIFQDTTEVSVWPGNDANLNCGDDHFESVRRFWRKDDEVLTAANTVMSSDDRIKQTNNSVMLVITNVNLEDQGEYVCIVNAKPKYRHTYLLRVKEVVCEVQDQPLNGFYRNETSTKGAIYKTGDRIRYFCNSGYRLVGPALRTCSGSTKEWAPAEPPYCEPEFIARLRHQLTGFETQMKEEVSDINHQVLTIQNQLPASYVNRSANPLLNRTIEKELADWFWESCHHNQKASGTNWKFLPNNSISEAGKRRVFMVSEYKWVVNNVKERVKLLSGSIRETQESPPFYSTIPGYLLKLKFTLYHTSDFNINLLITKGEFDAQLQWPARFKYELAVVLQNGTEIMYKVFNPSVYPGCLPKRPPPDVSASCPIARLAQFSDFYTQKKYISDDSSITFKAYVYI